MFCRILPGRSAWAGRTTIRRGVDLQEQHTQEHRTHDESAQHARHRVGAAHEEVHGQDSADGCREGVDHHEGEDRLTHPQAEQTGRRERAEPLLRAAEMAIRDLPFEPAPVSQAAE